MTSTQPVSHLHLRQVEVLRKSALSFKGYRILEEAGTGRVDRWESVGYNRFGCLFLVVRLGLTKPLPFQEPVLFLFVVFTEIAANCVHQWS